MEIVLHDDLAAFDAVAGPLLAADPVRNTTPLTVADGIRGGRLDFGAAATVHDDGRIVAAAVQSAGRAVLLAGVPAAAAPLLAERLHAEHAARRIAVSGVLGRADAAEAFAAAWTARAGTIARTAMATRLFELATLTAPTDVPGAARVAGEGDADLLAAWRRDFAVEALGGWPPGPSPADTVRRALAAGHASVLWEDGGEPVAVAAANAPVAGMSRVSFVWTPAGRRGRGYGSAVTAAASRWALDAGARHVVLFTDLANPTSNAIYPRLGYRVVEDGRELVFVAPGAPSPAPADRPPGPRREARRRAPR